MHLLHVVSLDKNKNVRSIREISVFWVVFKKQQKHYAAAVKWKAIGERSVPMCEILFRHKCILLHGHATKWLSLALLSPAGCAGRPVTNARLSPPSARVKFSSFLKLTMEPISPPLPLHIIKFDNYPDFINNV